MSSTLNPFLIRPSPPIHPSPPQQTGLGYEYETALAVSPLQRVLTYARGEAVLTGVPAWGWRLCEEWLVPFAEGLGYKAFYPEYSTRGGGSGDGGGGGGKDAAKELLHEGHGGGSSSF